MDLLFPPISHLGASLDDAELPSMVQILTSPNFPAAIQVESKPTTALAVSGYCSVLGDSCAENEGKSSITIARAFSEGFKTARDCSSQAYSPFNLGKDKSPPVLS